MAEYAELEGIIKLEDRDKKCGWDQEKGGFLGDFLWIQTKTRTMLSRVLEFVNYSSRNQSMVFTECFAQHI